MRLPFFLLIPLLLSLTLSAQPDTARIHEHLRKITRTDGFRNYRNSKALEDVSAYIFNHFAQYCDTVYYQHFTAKNSNYRNVVASMGPADVPVIVIGAHYDVCGNQTGADDNASGVVALLELARMLKGEKLKYRIELVSYANEEPPFFDTEDMGSYVHAKSLSEKKTIVYGMVCYDMIGYFSDSIGSQTYPLSVMSLFYGRKGNYITLVNKFGKGRFARRFTRAYKKDAAIRTKKFSGPRSIPGVDFSDHLHYWDMGYSATFITNTAFYRNKRYHTTADTIETLDLQKMADVIEATKKALLRIR